MFLPCLKTLYKPTVRAYSAIALALPLVKCRLQFPSALPFNSYRYRSIDSASQRERERERERSSEKKLSYIKRHDRQTDIESYIDRYRYMDRIDCQIYILYKPIYRSRSTDGARDRSIEKSTDWIKIYRSLERSVDRSIDRQMWNVVTLPSFI